MFRRVLVTVAASIATAACSSTDSGSIQIVTGEETDTFTRAPAPTKLKIQSVDTSGTTTTLSTTPLPATTVDLGSLDENTIASLRVTGIDAKGEPVVFGATLPLLFGGLNGLTVPVFVQRVGELARLPGPLGSSRQTPLLADVQGEYVFVAGGTSGEKTTELYDFGGFVALSSPPTLPLSPASAAFVGTYGWLFGADGAAQYFDLQSSAAASIPALAGGSFADIAGGATIVGDAGVQFVVGATRATGTPTAAVLEIDPNDASNQTYPYGAPTWLTLGAPRLGAGATWVSGRGLVVIGGNPTAPGVEIVPTGKTRGTLLPYPADPSTGVGATALSTETVLVAGGLAGDADPGARTIDLACASGCSPMVWATPLAVPLVSAQVFTMSASSAFLVGNWPVTGATHAYTVTASTLTEVPTKTSHVNARALWSPVGSVAIVGGSPLIETFVF